MITPGIRRALAATSVVGLCAVVAGAYAVLQPHPRGKELASAEHGGLQVRQDVGVGRRESGAPLRCFVEGRFVGSMTLETCAQKNGVSAQGLDVGLAPPADAGSTDPSLADPSPPAQGAPDLTVASARPAARVDATDADSRVQACLRYANDGWRTVGTRMPLAACVHTLYEGRCVEPGDALYGRSGELTLRLVPGRVESSDDDRRFRLVMTQNDDCTLDG